MKTFLVVGSCCFALAAAVADNSFSYPAPAITNFSVEGTAKNIRFPLYPGAEAYEFRSSSNASGPFLLDTNFVFSPYTNVLLSTGGAVTNVSYEWRATNNSGAARFYQVTVTPGSDSNLLAAHVLNRLTYGPSPDELRRIGSIGPEAYISEQLAPWSVIETADSDPAIAKYSAMLAALDEPITDFHARLPEFRAWHVLRAVAANRQLLELLLQFLENHFVTEYSKSYNWLNGNYEANTRRRLATRMESAENQRWRAALLNPQCTFYDLLKISAESPAMIIYLDTVSSRGDGTRVANENFARELLELFTWGVDNGYDQNDITTMSRAWTGWRVEIVHPTNAFNPFAPQSTTYLNTDPNAVNSVTNLYGVYTFNYKSNFHNNSAKVVFPNKTVPARFGPPWAGTSYQLPLNNGTSNSTNTIKDGYQVIQHLANQPFAAEYISVKLCRLLIHDAFPNPSTLTNQPEYDFYDYRRADLTPEARLVHDCMLTWETNSPKGQIWKILKTITDSDLFRSHAAISQKVKTPLEYTVSAIRALRASTNGSGASGTFTAETDGLAISGASLTNPDDSTAPLLRMGTMLLFDRDAPDGYPEDGPAWISAGTLAERIRWVQSYCIASGQSGHTGTLNDAGNSTCNPVRLLQAKLPPSSWTNASDVAGFFLRTLYPAEGAGNLQLYRNAAVNYLNTSDAGASSAFSALAVSSIAGSAYDNRVRSMVGMLMTLQRFHEQ